MASKYGLIGFPLEHSFSPAYFTKKFAAENINASYTAFPLEQIHLLPALLERERLAGLNVTIPYKTEVIGYLDYITTSAAAINAVNCICIQEGKLYGYNTDYMGFRESLRPLLRQGMDQALILGTGGSAKAVAYALQQMGIGYALVSSSGSGNFTYKELNKKIIDDHRIIINTTPLGMFPATNAHPDIPYDLLTSGHLLYDLIYNPEQTVFLQKGLQQGTRIKNGAEMLVIQADKSWDIWRGLAPDTSFIALR